MVEYSYFQTLMAKIDIVQVVHIVSNIIILSIITLFFKNKTQVLSDKIKELEGKLEAYEVALLKHEYILQELTSKKPVKEKKENVSFQPSFVMKQQVPLEPSKSASMPIIPNPLFGIIDMMNCVAGAANNYSDDRVEEVEEEINEELLDKEITSELVELEKSDLKMESTDENTKQNGGSNID